MPSPDPYQLDSIRWLRDRRFAILAHPPGLGKTVCVLRAARLPALIVAPAHLLLNWRREAELWVPDFEGGVDAVSYASPQLEGFGFERLLRYRTLVLDEAHYVKSPASKRSQLACRLVWRFLGASGRRAVAAGRVDRGRQPRSVYALSGTLVPNRPIEVWPLLWASGATSMRYEDFAYRYAAAFENAWGELDVRGASNLAELRRLLAPHCLRFEKADVMPWLPPKRYRVIALDLPAGQAEKRYSIRDLEKLEEMVAMSVMSTILREQGERKVASALAHVRDALEEEEKVIVFAHHRSVIAALTEGLRDFGCEMVQGGMTPGAKMRAVDAFQRSRSCRAIVGEVRTMGVGWNLTAARRVIFVEASWVPSDIEQAADRAHRRGQEDSVLVDLLTIDRSIDEHMLRRALEKQAKVGNIVPASNRP